jgi:hypothetical protein
MAGRLWGRDNERRRPGPRRKKDAAAALAKLVTSVHDHTYIEQIRTTVAEWPPSIRADVREWTWSSYRTTLGSDVVPRMGGVQLQRIGRTDLATLTVVTIDHDCHGTRAAGGRLDSSYATALP